MARNSSRRARGTEGADAAQPERINLYDEVTAKIIAQLEAGRIPWVQPWASCAASSLGSLSPGLPRNALDEKRIGQARALDRRAA